MSDEKGGMEVTLAKDVRLFYKHQAGGRQLGWNRDVMKAGTKVLLLLPEPVIYDHRDQEAVMVTNAEDGEFYILLDELEPNPWKTE